MHELLTVVLYASFQGGYRRPHDGYNTRGNPTPPPRVLEALVATTPSLTALVATTLSLTSSAVAATSSNPPAGEEPPHKKKLNTNAVVGATARVVHLKQFPVERITNSGCIFGGRVKFIGAHFNSEGEVFSLNRDGALLKTEPLHRKPSILNLLPHTFPRRTLDSPASDKTQSSSRCP